LAFLLHHLLAESAAQWPGKEAVRDLVESLTYGQLDRVTDQLARALHAAGIRRGDRVGIYVHKSVASVVSVFGVLKAGGICVPLDPNAPAARLAYITRDCGIRLLITASAKVEAAGALYRAGTPVTTLVLTDGGSPLAAPPGAKVVTWDEVRTGESRPLPPPGTIETDLAYILYTSGSTGEPKGVMIAHRTLFTFINWCGETFRIGPDDRVTSHAPLHFDLSTFDIYVTLKAGATIVTVPEKMSLFPVQIVELLQRERITATYLVPSILSMMVIYGQLASHDLSALRLVLFAGEVFPVKYLRQLMAAVPQADYYNLYGPTETNVCTYYKVQARDVAQDRTEPVPIGAACANTEVFAVDDYERLVSDPGQEGELWVRGPCVAQGYWGDPEKTAAKFVRNPFQPAFHEVAYRTGDIVVLDEDRMNWRYVGRRDHMVKSRGYRVELGEIEAVLYTHPGVKEAAVIAIPDELIGNRLKAFVVPVEHNGPTVKELRAYCSMRLPGYMVPESVDFRAELPKTSTGKVNRPLLAGNRDT
jgi:amino acid adenylation domain-containing protein